MSERTVYFVFDAAGEPIGAFSDRREAERLAAYFGWDEDAWTDGGIAEVILDRPADAWALADEHGSLDVVRNIPAPTAPD